MGLIMYVEVRGPFGRVSSLPPCGFYGLNSGYQAKVTLPLSHLAGLYLTVLLAVLRNAMVNFDFSFTLCRVLRNKGLGALTSNPRFLEIHYLGEGYCV